MDYGKNSLLEIRRMNQRPDASAKCFQRISHAVLFTGIGAFIQLEIGQIIVAKTDTEKVKGLLKPDREELRKLIVKG